MLKLLRTWSVPGLALCLALMAGCGREPPLRVGLLAELSGNSADLGEAARNGAALALDEAQASNLLGSRKVVLRVRDTGEYPASAREALGVLLMSGVDFVVGPGTSSMTAAVLPAVDEFGVVMISPSASALALYGVDDYLFRVNWTTRDNAGHYARYCHARGFRRLAVAVNADNRTYSESWLQEFRTAFEPLGGRLDTVRFFDLRADSVSPLVDDLLATPSDALLFVASAADTTRLAQQVRKRDARRPLIAADWAGTQQLIELGGRAVEGLHLVQNFDVEDRSPRFQKFVNAYRDRFGREPSFQSVMAYDAMSVALQAAARQPRGSTFKQTLLSMGPFHGLQQSLDFDVNGDIQRAAYFMRVRDGHFVREQ
ncbi:MAG: hypothetical protein BSR46_04220 [Candidatus Dactylopiibacterium carminicum]|nr:ABC transporter substrate-binding protein [Candidatus Dactylopiibacterium carminicum]PAT00156.1 MAG: hypothetical protein BSR46_04220 [Candidatus Dactylopiibacterium carminicum]